MLWLRKGRWGAGYGFNDNDMKRKPDTEEKTIKENVNLDMRLD